ncbi:hypothetical protein L249_4657 [Ophiocordyceps polyrhachis-furcata BCC 54312]|uniref:BTB domain-containing protein n=1 Tax=Ophiocordyceps polyrhachis-furcata BCC 54312 TaxID=1330021 RepID=A0A367L2Y9_9HYPO|nr:hypothetical protein L249_4657 [Ophiocordyceps polyrhachis-furcata BCC 54312]
MFTFAVGPNEREFVVHADLFAKQSPVLSSLMNGSFREAEDAKAFWCDTDEETFIRFCQYTYTGDYDEAPVTIDDVNYADQNVAADHDEPDVGNRCNVVQPLVRAPEAVSRPGEYPMSNNLWQAFCFLRGLDFINDFPLVPDRFFSSYKPRVNKGRAENYTDVFLAHARLYIFSDRYGLERLAQIALLKLHKILIKFRLFKERAGDLVPLVELVYCNPVPQVIRHLVGLYAACKIRKLWRSDDFRELVGGCSELSMSLLGFIVTYV